MGLEARISSGNQKGFNIPLPEGMSKRKIEEKVRHRIRKLIHHGSFAEAKALRELYDNNVSLPRDDAIAAYEVFLSDHPPDLERVVLLEAATGIPLPQNLASSMYKRCYVRTNRINHIDLEQLDRFADRYELDAQGLQRKAVIEEILAIRDNNVWQGRQYWVSLVNNLNISKDKRISRALQQVYKVFARKGRFDNLYDLAAIFDVEPKFSMRFIQECADTLVGNRDFEKLEGLGRLNNHKIRYSRKVTRKVSIAAARDVDVSCLNQMAKYDIPIELSLGETRQFYRALQASGKLHRLDAKVEEQLGSLPDNMLQTAAEQYLRQKRNGTFMLGRLATGRKSRLRSILPAASVQAAYHRFIRQGDSQSMESLYTLTGITPDISPQEATPPNHNRMWRTYVYAVTTIMTKYNAEMDLSKQHPTVVAGVYEYAFRQQNMTALKIMNDTVGAQLISETTREQVYHSLAVEEKFSVMVALSQAAHAPIPLKIHQWIR